MRPEVGRAVALGGLASGVLAALIVVGSRELEHFDAALVGYTFGTLFAAFGVTYRYAMWLQRPPTSMYFRRGVRLALDPRNVLASLGRLGSAAAGLSANLFIFRRHPLRGLAHLLILWGCAIAAAITFPLVFGWLHFQSVEGAAERYRTIAFGISVFEFEVDSLVGGMIFHGLLWASLLVIVGVMIAMHRRMRDDGAASLQAFGEDFLPLILLFAISVTGVMLVVSYEWMRGYAYEFLSLTHAAIVILTLLYLPFGKLFHVFQRPAQVGIALYKGVGAAGEQAACRRCGEPFASKMHVEDLVVVQRQLGFRYELEGDAEHYAWICPRCRRRLVALAHDRVVARDGQGLRPFEGD